MCVCVCVCVCVFVCGGGGKGGDKVSAALKMLSLIKKFLSS